MALPPPTRRAPSGPGTDRPPRETRPGTLPVCAPRARQHGQPPLLRHRLPVRVRRTRETWYGHWRSNGRQVKRTLGADPAARQPRRPHPHAGRGRAARLIADTQVTPRGRRAARRRRGRRAATCCTPSARAASASTRQNIESEVRVHLAAVLRRPVDRRDHARGRARPRRRARGARASRPKTIRNIVGDALGAVQLRHGAAAPLGDREPVRGRRAARGPRRDGDPVPDARRGRRARRRTPARACSRRSTARCTAPPR